MKKYGRSGCVQKKYSFFCWQHFYAECAEAGLTQSGGYLTDY